MKIITVLILVVVSFFAQGCSHIEIIKAYRPSKVKVNDDISLSFTMETTADNSVEGVTTYGEPYKLMVLVPFEPGMKVISMEDLVLIGQDGDQLKVDKLTKDLETFELPIEALSFFLPLSRL